MQLLLRHAMMLAILQLVLAAGCTTYVHNDAAPSNRPPAKVKVDVRTGERDQPGAKVDINVNKEPGSGVNVDVKKNP